MESMLVTLPTFHLEISWLKDALPLNRYAMLVTSDVSQSGMSMLPAAPQSAFICEQQFSPEGTAAIQLSTATFRVAELEKNGASGGEGGDGGEGGGLGGGLGGGGLGGRLGGLGGGGGLWRLEVHSNIHPFFSKAPSETK
jgi:hypothetical protein